MIKKEAANMGLIGMPIQVNSKPLPNLIKNTYLFPP